MKSSLRLALIGVCIALTLAVSACSSSSGSDKQTTIVYTVTFNSMEATTAATPATKTVTGPATSIDALPSAPVKTDYTFGGWWTEPDGKGTQFDATTSVSDNITVHAYWISNLFSMDSNIPANTSLTINGASNMSALGGTTVFALAQTKSRFYFSSGPVYNVYNSSGNLISTTSKSGGVEFIMPMDNIRIEVSGTVKADVRMPNISGVSYILSSDVTHKSGVFQYDTDDDGIGDSEYYLDYGTPDIADDMQVINTYSSGKIALSDIIGKNWVNEKYYNNSSYFGAVNTLLNEPIHFDTTDNLKRIVLVNYASKVILFQFMIVTSGGTSGVGNGMPCICTSATTFTSQYNSADIITIGDTTFTYNGNTYTLH